MRRPSKLRPDLSTLFPSRDREDLFSVHEMLRDYAKHEDDLINQRSNWHLLIQGFLFATFGVMGEWQSNNFLEADRFPLLRILAWTGLGIALSVLCSISAAQIALLRLQRKWNGLPKQYKVPRKLWSIIPKIGGTGSAPVVLLGMIPSLAIPIIISCAWVGILKYAKTERPTDPIHAGTPQVRVPDPPPNCTCLQTSSKPTRKKSHVASRSCPAVTTPATTMVNRATTAEPLDGQQDEHR